MSNPNFDKLLDQFNEHALRPILAASKEKLDQTLAAMPASELARALEDSYAQIQNTDVASNLAAVDPAKIADAVEAVKAQLQKPAVSKAVAFGVKQFLDRNSTDDLQDTIAQLTANSSPIQQLTFQMVLFQLSPKLDALRDASVNDIAAQIRTGADNLSGDDIAAQLSMALQAAPMLFPAQQAPDLTSQLPAPQDVADAVQALGEIASSTLDNAAKGATFAETVSALKQFAANANAALSRITGQDSTPPAQQKPATEQPAKKPSAPKKRKGGKGYKF